MKALKITLVAIALLVALVAAFYIGKLFGSHDMAGIQAMSNNAMGDRDSSHTAMTDYAMAANNDSPDGEKKIKYWVAPMDPNFRRDKPGKSPMGMDLVPVYDEPDTKGSDVTISSAVEQNLGVRTALVEKTPFVQTIEAVGSTMWNESSISMLHTRAEGWLEIFNIASVGDRVEEGDILFEVFSPLLVTAQNEFLIAKRSGNRALLRASEKRLLSLGVSESQMEELSRSGTVLQRLPHRAMRSGIITDLRVRPGMYVKPATNVATMVSDDSIWLNINVFESDAAQIRPGRPVSIWFDAFPGEKFSGSVSYIYPELNMPTRTVRVRIELPNADRRLKANMFARVALESDRRMALQVPREAVIRSGAGSRVITATGEGGFDVAVVKTGSVNNSHIEILEGLAAGDRVVTSGQFLLDAEANGEQAMARLMAEKSMVPAFGVIDEFLPDNKLTITHDPVPELGWPAMTMDFVAAPELNLSADMQGKPGDFSMRKNADGMWELVEFKPAGSEAMMEQPMGSMSSMSGTAKSQPSKSMSADEMATEKSKKDMGIANSQPMMTSAKVVAIELENRRIKLDHEAIQSLGMSAMTMKFKVDSDLPLEQYRNGDAVRFQVEMKPGKGMVITQMEKQ